MPQVEFQSFPVTLEVVDTLTNKVHSSITLNTPRDQVVDLDVEGNVPYFRLAILVRDGRGTVKFLDYFLPKGSEYATRTPTRK